ncbi:MAG: methyltransferase domain-containing protein, partial [Actinobacteria bacterium]|nr:methyltransferase domain-containing protein [Actinomycetota bacterium]
MPTWRRWPARPCARWRRTSAPCACPPGRSCSRRSPTCRGEWWRCSWWACPGGWTASRQQPARHIPRDPVALGRQTPRSGTIPRMSTQRRDTIAGGFTETASDYEGAVRFNLEGVQRLVLSVPPGRYDDVLDVGCGSGWAAQAVIDRFHPARVTGVDPSGGMLEQF